MVRTTSVIATGLASAGAAFLTSRFGIAGTVFGTAVMVMLLTAGSSIMEVFLETAANKVRAIPGGLLARDGRAVETAPAIGSRGPGGIFAGFAPLSAARRKSLLAGAAATAAASFLIGMGVVTGVELSVGKSLSCWVWTKCPAQAFDEHAGPKRQTNPSVLGGQATPEPAPKVEPAATDQPEYPRPIGPLAPPRQKETPTANRAFKGIPSQDSPVPVPSSEVSRRSAPPQVSDQTVTYNGSAEELSASPTGEPNPAEDLPNSLQQPVQPPAQNGWMVPEAPVSPEPGQ